jgi:cobalt-zinc-cadmium efflux system protein
MHGRTDDRQGLSRALLLTAGFFFIELIGGWWTNSLALLSDAAHMFTDVAALALGWFALWVSERPPSESKTFGYYRAEILAAFLNGVFLCLIVLWITYEAYARLHEPTHVRSGAMVLIATAGLLVNLFSAWILKPDVGSSLNRRAAFLHVFADLLGSVGAIAAGTIMFLTGWFAVDSIAAVLIAALVLLSSWKLLREAVDVLMEAVPYHIDLDQLRGDLESVPGTDRVHDLHVWTLTTGQYALSAHAVIHANVDGEWVLEEMRKLLDRRFEIHHVTIQLERSRPCEPESVHA